MAELKAERKSIFDFFSKTEKFTIPEYQRPYKWDFEKCEQLWKDIEDAFDDSPEDDYFLGSVVIYNHNKETYIIDG